jgi:anti-anti-sigma factor
MYFVPASLDFDAEGEFDSMPIDEMNPPLIGLVEEIPLVLKQPPAVVDRRIENWIASNLDLAAEATTNGWSQAIENLPVGRRISESLGAQRRGTRSQGVWSRFKIAYRQGITVVRVVDQCLVQRSHIREFGDDLTDLIAVGNHRLILNFTAVERLGSWIVGVVASAHRQCAAGDGGQLKICGLEPHLALVFGIVGMAGELALYPDEISAIDSPWPEQSRPRALPIDILAAITTAAELPPVTGGGPAEHSSGVDLVAPQPDPPQSVTSAAPRPTSGKRLWLHVQVGSTAGRKVSVPTSRFVIGRDQTCNLRLGSAQVSKQHAAVEQREGRVFLVDLGSTNGTTVGGRRIQNQELELRHGDRIQIGPVVSTVLLGSAGEFSGLDDEMGTEALGSESTAPVAANAELPSTIETTMVDEADPNQRIKVEVIQEVLVITPQLPELVDELTNEALRSKLHALFEQSMPRRVVVNLEFVAHLTRQTIALLLAHHLRLDRAGGAMRLCQAHARIVALLDQVSLTMLVDYYPTLDEAVLAAWMSNVQPPSHRA